MAHRSYGLNVARLARVPKGVLEVASEKSREMELDVQSKKLAGFGKLISNVVSDEGGGSDDVLEQLLVGIEQL